MSDLTKSGFKAQTLEVSLGHINESDKDVLRGVRSDFVLEKDGQFVINNDAVQNVNYPLGLFDGGSDALMFVVDYALMAGYEKLILGADCPRMADFDWFGD